MTRRPTYQGLQQRVKELEEVVLEHKGALAELRRYTAELEQDNQQLRQLADSTSNDLQEPLDIVMTYLRFVEARYKGRLGSDADEFIGSAVDGAKRMQSIITALSEIAQKKVGTKGPEGFEPP